MQFVPFQTYNLGPRFELQTYGIYSWNSYTPVITRSFGIAPVLKEGLVLFRVVIGLRNPNKRVKPVGDTHLLWGIMHQQIVRESGLHVDLAY